MRLSIVIIFCCQVVAVLSQDPTCAYRATPEDYRRIAEMERLAAQLPKRIYEDNVVKVGMYRLQYSDGSGAYSDSVFAAQINHLNTFYEAHDICFSLVRVQNINHSPYLEVDWDDGDTADSTIAVINQDWPSFFDALTIYVLPPDVFYHGSAFGIPSTAMFITSHPNRWNTSHIAHEAGHCLGNFHTHDDTETFHSELVNRFCPIPSFPANGHIWFDACTGADGFVDTPADPTLNDTNALGEQRVVGCVYVDSITTDGFGELFSPMVSNLMCYAPLACRSDLTGQQVTRLHLTLDLNTEYNNKQAPTTRELNGETISGGHRHEMAKTTMMVSNSNAYIVNIHGQVMHEAEGSVTLYPGFLASPSSNVGFYVARAKDLCNNSTTLDYSIKE